MKKINYYFVAIFAFIFTNSMAQVDLSKGLIGKFYFSGNASDSSGLGNHGTVNGATLTTDRCGNSNAAYYFDGINDNITVSNVGKGLNNFSYSIWVYASVIPGEGMYTYPFCLGNSDISHNIALCNNSMKGWSAGSSNDGTPVLSLLSMGSQINRFKWYHLVLIRDASNLKLYVNGVLNTNDVSYDGFNKSNGGKDASYPDNCSVYIGSRGYLSQFFFNGKIDDIRIYNRVINDDEIDSLFNEQGCQLTSLNTVKKEMEIESSLDVFPNPNNGDFNLTFNHPSQNSYIKLIDINGKTIYNESIKDGLYSHEIKNNNFAPGVYYILYKSEQGLLSKKVIIQ